MKERVYKPVCSISHRTLRLLGVAALFVASQGAGAETTAQTEVNVGTVSLVLGKAYIESADKPRQRVWPGTAIHVNDQIVTEANGHVHIQFVDSAKVSVRPDSLLEIVRYDYDASNPSQSSIKLNLVEGVTRAISGDGAKAARERFRLNTPIAAIGVRGTDFVVSATEQSVRALVNEGAIVVAPYSSDCLATNFGPCATNAVELTQESLQVVQLDGDTPLPTLVPAPDERGPLGREDVAVEVEVASADTGAEDKVVGTGVYLETVTSRKVTEVASNAVVPVPPVKPVDPVKPPPAVVDYTPTTAVASAVLDGNQLAWGRYSNEGGQERITLEMGAAQQGRKIAIAILGVEYRLFRKQDETDRVARNLGVVSFGLDSAQAFYHSDTGVVAMQVNSGSLTLDFDQNRFSTQLGLNHAATGKVDFSASDRIQNPDGGYFYNKTDTQSMTGTVSLDGKEAAYFFDKQLSGGVVKGLTLWDKQ